MKLNKITGKMVQEVAHGPGGCNLRSTLKGSGEITTIDHMYIEDGSLVHQNR